MRLIFKIVGLFIFIADVNSTAFDDIIGCSTGLAEICFRGFFTSLVSLSEEHSEDNISDICSTTDERISCASNIIDSDCNIKDGRANFDNWVQGLTSVYNYLCIESRHSLNDMLMTYNGERCFDLINYIQCVEHKTRVTHIIDLLHVSLDVNECNWILIAFTTCGTNSINRDSHCDEEKIEHTLNEIVQIFIQQTRCTNICSNSSRFHISIEFMLLLFIFVKLL
ncbi:uncharacterized protein LOC106670683 [Cimex lectularius]|uniref:Odorant binding protein n=1 Tax=Cimex lectularius TaxID=79782 RepID=A0A8I6S4I7_CIMLE|nr:uncharacterized protein LOC106670683 [Cimex lectularius]